MFYLAIMMSLSIICSGLMAKNFYNHHIIHPNHYLNTPAFYWFLGTVSGIVNVILILGLT